jgi:hypothetical protein
LLKLRKPQACLCKTSILVWKPSVMPLFLVKRRIVAISSLQACRYCQAVPSAAVAALATGDHAQIVRRSARHCFMAALEGTRVPGLTMAEVVGRGRAARRMWTSGTLKTAQLWTG